jgi:hypothetical protein
MDDPKQDPQEVPAVEPAPTTTSDPSIQQEGTDLPLLPKTVTKAPSSASIAPSRRQSVVNTTSSTAESKKSLSGLANPEAAMSSSGVLTPTPPTARASNTSMNAPEHRASRATSRVSVASASSNVGGESKTSLSSQTVAEKEELSRIQACVEKLVQHMRSLVTM